MQNRTSGNTGISKELYAIYARLRNYFGFLDWWPGESPFEIMIGAILTQNTNWQNVEKAIHNLKSKAALSPHRLLKLPSDPADPSSLEQLIRPSGYYNQKTKRLRGFMVWYLERFEGDIDRMKSQSTVSLRDELLGLNGIGPETADSILLYACDKEIFVIDAYTRRVMHRLGYTAEKEAYVNLQCLFMEHLKSELIFFQDFHAQFVYLGKTFCKPKPICASCPLREICDCCEKYAF